MTRDRFVDALKLETSDAAVAGTLAWLKKPAGRQPAHRKIELSTWFNNLSDSDRHRVEQIARESAELAVFSFLSLLDGMSFVDEEEEKGKLELFYERGFERLLLNDPNAEYLHDIYNSKLALSSSEKKL
jgi:hypothetical protein